MQFSFALIAAAACAVANAVIITNGPASFVGLTAGRALNITWADAQGPVTLLLKTGEANALTTVTTIGSGLTGGSTSYIFPATTPVGFYALEIQDSTAVPNYSVRFEVTGGPSSGSASGSSTSTGSSASASATNSRNSTITSSSSSATGTGSTTSGSASRTATSTSASGSSTASAPPNTNSGASFASPLAFVLLAFAALMTLN